MDAALFDYHLPPKCIAQEPASTRDASRLMVVDRKNHSVKHTHFSNIGEYLPRNARFYRNNAAVLKARIYGYRSSGGKVECLLLQPAEDAHTWWCLLRPGKKVTREGFGLEDEFSADVIEVGSNGCYRVRFHLLREESVTDLADRLGIMPLPPYISRTENDPRYAQDAVRYQTVYADPNKRLAVAAPTAGLHFTDTLIDELKNNGARFYDLTLQVGIGTFHPIKVDDITQHSIHHESYEIPRAVHDSLLTEKGGPRVAVGTTSVRSIEDVMRRSAKQVEALRSPSGSIQAEADIFIFPPATFAGVDHLITNFHLPKSSLLCLVSAFLTPGSKTGIDWLKQLYNEAIEQQYRFYSYGDAMLIL